MHLSDTQIDEFDHTGFLLFRGLLDEAAVQILRDEQSSLINRPGPEVVREKETNGVRLAYGAHVLSDPFAKLSVMPRLLNPVKQLLRSDAYIHQSRLNPKFGFTGGEWNWHQDFGTWHREDGMPQPNCVMTAIFLDDATAVNGPLMVLPGTQKHGIVNDVAREEATGYTVMQIDHDLVRDYVSRNGIVPLMGPAGTVAFIHCNLVHGSSNNVSPLPRSIMYFNYNSVDNVPTGGNNRPWFHNNPDRTPLQPCEDDVLDVMARDSDRSALGAIGG